MTHIRRPLFVGLILLGASLSVGCHLGITNRPALFPSIAYSPSYARAGAAGTGTAAACGCGRPGCYREFGPNSGCGTALFAGRNAGAGPAVTGPVMGGTPGFDAPPAGGMSYGGFDMPMYGSGFTAPVPTPGCAGCGAGGGGMSGIPIAGSVGGPPIAVSPAGGPIYGVPQGMPGGGPVYGVPYDSGAVPTLKPPPGSIPLQMPSEVKEAKKIAITGK